MNKKIITAFACMGVCGVLALSSIPFVSVSADVVTEYPPSLDTFDPTNEYGFISLGRAVTTMYSYTNDELCLTFNTSDIYGFTDPISQYVVSHRLDLDSYCMEYPYITSSADYYQAYRWDGGYFESNTVYLKFQFFNEFLPCANDSIGNVHFAFSNADVVWSARLYGSIFDVGSKTFKNFDFTVPSVYDSFAYMVDLCATYSGSVDGYGYNGYQYFDSLTIDLFPLNFQDSVSHSIFVYPDGYGTGYSDYISSCDSFRSQYFSGGPSADPGNTYAFIIDSVRGFLATEFLPDFSFGHLLMLSLGCLMLGLGLKISLGG